MRRNQQPQPSRRHARSWSQDCRCLTAWPRPSPRANIPTVRDCDDVEIGTDICMSEDDFVTIFVLLKELDAYADLIGACPGTQIMTDRVKVTPTNAPVDERRKI